MQSFGISSLLLCVVTMFLVYTSMQIAAQITFGVSLIFMIISLALSLREILMSAEAIKLELSDLRKEE